MATVTAAANLTDNAIVRGDGGATDVQTSAVYIDDLGRLSIGATSGTEKVTLTSGNFLINAFGDAGFTGYAAQHGIFFRVEFSPNGANGGSEVNRRNVSITTGQGTANLGDALDINGYHHVSVFTNGVERARIEGDGKLRLLPYTTPGALVASSNGTIFSSSTFYGVAYGIIADGMTDNAAALGNLLDAAIAAGRSKVILQPGIIVVGSTITKTLAHGIEIQGAGINSTVLLFTGGTHGFDFTYNPSSGLHWIDGSVVTIHDMSVVTNQNSTGAAIRIYGNTASGVPAPPTTLRDLHIYGASDGSGGPTIGHVACILKRYPTLMFRMFTYWGTIAALAR